MWSVLCASAFCLLPAWHRSEALMGSGGSVVRTAALSVEVEELCFGPLCPLPLPTNFSFRKSGNVPPLTLGELEPIRF